MAKRESTIADPKAIALPADPNDPEDGDVTFEAVERGLEERRTRRMRGPQALPTKEAVSIRLDADLLAKLRASGAGWQGRVNETLRKAAGL